MEEEKRPKMKYVKPEDDEEQAEESDVSMRSHSHSKLVQKSSVKSSQKKAATKLNASK